MAKKDGCPLCGRGNCLSQSKPKKKASRINRLAPIVTDNALKALQIAANHGITELEKDDAKRDLFVNYVRNTCDSINEVNLTDCRLMASIFGKQLVAKYYSKAAGQTRHSLSHVLMTPPNFPTLHRGVVTHFPVWYRTFCEMLCEASLQNDWKIQGATHYARRYQRRMESLKGMPNGFESVKAKWENLAFQKAIDETTGPAWSIEEAKQYSMADRLTQGGFHLVQFSENGEPNCSEVSPHWGDPTRMGCKYGSIYRRIVSHNPLWAWESEMDGMYSCEFSPEEMHPKSLCQWQKWDSPQGELHAKQIEAEMEYIRDYKAHVQPYANKLRGQNEEEAEQSKYDTLILHLSPDAPAPLVVHTLPADQNLSPQERFESVNESTIAQMFIAAGHHPSNIGVVRNIHGSLHESKLLKRNAFVAHITLANSQYSWPTDETKELVWSTDT